MLNKEEINRVIEMAWEDRTPFDIIHKEFNLTHDELIRLMRNNLKRSSFKLWRKRVNGRRTKHLKLRVFSIGRHRCDRQGKINSHKR